MTGNPDVTAPARLLAVEVLLAEPDLRPRARIAAELRARIIHAIIAPGTQLDTDEIAGIAGPWLPPKAAVQALSDLKTEGLVTWHRYRWYATPAGPAGPAAGARLGTTLATLRRASGRTPDDLAAGRYWTCLLYT